jgi:hypothetical protein
MIFQLNPQIEVITPLGKGWAYFLIDYDLNTNTIWLVRLDFGIVKHFDSNDIKITPNLMLGQI